MYMHTSCENMFREISAKHVVYSFVIVVGVELGTEFVVEFNFNCLEVIGVQRTHRRNTWVVSNLLFVLSKPRSVGLAP